MTAKRKCGGKKRSGGTCTQAAGWGTDHAGTGKCKLHGGSTRTGRKSAQREQAVDAVQTYGLPREVDPHAALLEELHRTAGHVAWLGHVVADLESRHLVHGITKTVQHPDGTRAVEARAAVNVWVELYHRERSHFAKVAKTCVDVGIAERQVVLAEQQAQQLARVVTAILADLGHDLNDERTRQVVRLRLLEGGKAA